MLMDCSLHELKNQNSMLILENKENTRVSMQKGDHTGLKYLIVIFLIISIFILFALVNAWYGFPFWKTIEGSYSALGGHMAQSDLRWYRNESWIGLK